MKHLTKEKGNFTALKKGIKIRDYVYCLKLEVPDINQTITLPIGDAICETLGISELTPKVAKEIVDYIPNTLNVSNIEGYWKLQNEGIILSDAISKYLH